MWKDRHKLDASLAYLTNSRARTKVEAVQALKIALAILGVGEPP